jgi:alkylhydroperoxidase/carboxymuconolactone decarboxylase family protein YurZ
VNPQLKGHLKGAINNGANLEEVRAVRDIVIKLCEAAGMKVLEGRTLNGWGWRDEVAKL